jgi:hypothetical protein
MSPNISSIREVGDAFNPGKPLEPQLQKLD